MGSTANADTAHSSGMPSPATDQSNPRRRNMQANRRRDTSPEIALRSALHRRGLRYRCDFLLRLGSHRVRPDIVFTKRHIAVFVDGCFWHCCPEHGRFPRVNPGYRTPKLQRNRDRDERNNQALRDAGWNVIRVWEHESTDSAVDRVLDALSGAVSTRSMSADTANSADL